MKPAPFLEDKFLLPWVMLISEKKNWIFELLIDWVCSWNETIALQHHAYSREIPGVFNKFVALFSMMLLSIGYLSYFYQIGGLPTNISFLQRLANHQAFENGLVETHFIEHFKDDLLVNSSGALSVESHTAAKLGATVAAACICRLEQIISSENISGRDNLLSLWYAHPPFRMHHSAQRVVELEWDKVSDGTDTELFKLFITYQTDGSYLVQTGSEDPGVQVKVTHIGKCDFRVDVNGLSTDVSLAIYSKEDCKHIHIWHAELQHHFWQKIQPEQSGDDVSEHKASFETASHPKGSVVAPMAGLVVKVLVENGKTVEAGEPILVLEAMKMEHVVKAPRSGCISGLQVAPGQQIFDADVLFSVKDA